MTQSSSNRSNSKNTLNMNGVKTSDANMTSQISYRPERISSSNGQSIKQKLSTEDSNERMKEAVRTILLSVEENPEREGLLNTPKRFAEAMQFLTSGYSQSLEEIVNGAIFDEGHNEMVLVRDINFFSLCEQVY